MRYLSLLTCVVLTSCLGADESRAKRSAFDRVDADLDQLREINRTIWEAAEVGLQETRSSATLIAYLESNGFDVEKGVAGMPTAFVASYGTGKPVIAILAEYDALPGMSQRSEPTHVARVEDGAGHACGHSVFGTASVAAAVAVRSAMERHGLPGTIRVYGTPAEETGIGKTYMVKEGLFKDCDAALHWHPSDRTQSSFSLCKAVVSVKYTFHGLAAHASLSPHDGRSALDGVELMNIGANYLREHLKEDARIHYVITDGGGQPNVVPPKAQVWYYLRANDHADVEYMFRRMEKVAKGAAMMTDTKVEIEVASDSHELVPNRVLSEIVQRNLELVGPPRFTAAEKVFARETQKPLVEMRGRDLPMPLSEIVLPLPKDPVLVKASTDVGDVSWMVPTSGCRVASYTFGAPGHSWQIVACTGMSIGEKGLVIAAKALAGSAVELLSSPTLVSQAKADFKKWRGERPYTSLIPKEQKAPVKIR
jgi:aminobenzoyl-glutamate utilization protein B